MTTRREDRDDIRVMEPCRTGFDLEVAPASGGAIPAAFDDLQDDATIPRQLAGVEDRAGPPASQGPRIAYPAIAGYEVDSGRGFAWSSDGGDGLCPPPSRIRGSAVTASPPQTGHRSGPSSAGSALSSGRQTWPCQHTHSQRIPLVILEVLPGTDGSRGGCTRFHDSMVRPTCPIARTQPVGFSYF